MIEEIAIAGTKTYTGQEEAHGQLLYAYRILTTPEVTEGIYFIRMMLEFNYNGTPYIMKSKGHFSQNDWDYATIHYDEVKDVGKINISHLGVDGIIPDTSISIKYPIPIWPVYMLAVLCVICGVFAIIFYAIDEHGMFPELERRFQSWTGRLNETKHMVKRSIFRRSR